MVFQAGKQGIQKSDSQEKYQIIEQETLDILSVIKEESDKCIHCSLCLEGCSTYQATHIESQSPRGRIELGKLVVKKMLSLEDPIFQTFNDCLACGVCTKLCPYEVDFQKLHYSVQRLRLDQKQDKHPLEKTAFHLANFHSYWSRFWLNQKLQKKAEKPIYPLSKAGNQPVYTLLISCYEQLYHQEIIQQLINIFNYLKIPFKIDKNQPCCGDIFTAIDMKKQLKMKKSLDKWLPDYSCYLSLNCFSKTASQTSVYQLIDQYLNAQDNQQNLFLNSERKYFYQPSCKGDDQALLSILQRIENLTLYPLSPSCCGNAHLNTLFDDKKAQVLFAQKELEIDLPDTILVSSFECLSQFSTHDKPAIHAIEIIKEALN